MSRCDHVNKRARPIFRSSGLVETVTRSAEPGIHSPARFRVRAPSVGRLAGVSPDPALSCEASVISRLRVQILASCRGLDCAVSKKCQLNATTARRITPDPPETLDRFVDSHPCSSSKPSIRSGARNLPGNTLAENRQHVTGHNTSSTMRGFPSFRDGHPTTRLFPRFGG